MKYAVVTPTGLIVYESDQKRMCSAYIRQALRKGSVPGFLEVICQ